MADHFRATLMAAIGARLTDLVTTQNRVYPNRIYPLQGDDLPGITIRAQEPEILASTIHGPATYERKLSITVRGYSKAVYELGATLDSIGQEVEIAMSTAVTVGAKSVDFFLRSVHVEAVQADKPVGMIEMIYETSVFTAANQPDVLL